MTTARADALAGLGDERREWVERAYAHVDRARLRDLATSVVNIPSPTGDEAPLARHITAVLAASGIEAHTMDLDDRQANSWGRLRGDGSGPDLLLYAPIDTVTTGDPAEDLPWVGNELRADLTPHAQFDENYVIGLGASNPKGHAVCIVAAAEAIAAAGIPLRGDLVLGFGAGGMPTNARPGVGNPRRNTGQGVGCSFLLEQGVWADCALIAKPGWTVSWEEVGLAWFEITVHGLHTYVGSRHRLPYRNAITAAGEVVAKLEEWFPKYSAAHQDGLVAPQGIVANIRGGWERTASFTPEQVRLTVDLRLSPRTTPTAAKRELKAVVAEIAQSLDLQIDIEQVLAIPGEGSDPRMWLRRAAVHAWEAAEGEPHQDFFDASGATDANILRSRGIPTIRVGMPKVVDAPFEVDFAMGMNTVDLAAAERFTKYLIRVALDTVTRSLEEVGID
ncbi:MAG: peptidase dimerization domain-containing protein [Rhodococcus qingshengii]|jgi:acetylornithine deacetylase/succinyl-diaminopimelate desuccinylase-like protein|uniref:M20 family metallopeptidase n=1 Tax=Rhodococcus TaxID=1827 RepID=UPI00067F3761|nr:MULTISPECIES: peptidase dimerization domain-containing protein [Rhodococcus]AUS29976.1 deacylase [Rhodococcus qingshengii]MBS3694317.1 peptidase dimerization domain-containing protein [Rhodococcus qingshengii]MCC4302319.1 peptidase dimerization domain-containing protein [Rhodococcus sp. 3-2]MDI9943018.1 peptidase dimerization domain-containing protein [Rhodococcus sp. IEGM 1302]OMQ31421.1 deacylase [Rhodococcus sp. D-1]